MNKLKFNYSNYNLTPLQLENSAANEKEYDSGTMALDSFPRRILLTLDSYLNPGSSKDFYHPRHLKPLIPAMNFSEELILFSSFPAVLPDNIQPILDKTNDYMIKKSIIADAANLVQLSPWVFQYNVSKVHILVDPSGDLNSVQKAVRELVVRKYFANTKPVINIVYKIGDIDDSLIMPMLLLPYEAEADCISLVFNDLSNDSAKFISKIKEKTDYYGIALKVPHEDAGELRYSPWSDICINYNGRLMDFPGGENISDIAPEPEASFQSDIWNSSGMLKLRSEARNMDISQFKHLYNHIL